MAIEGEALNTNLTNAPAKIMVAAESTELVAVSRWGSEQEANYWVMQGRPTLWNYIWSGKYQVGLENQFASPYNVQWYIVPQKTLQCPKGKGIDGSIKLLLPGKQRIYRS